MVDIQTVTINDGDEYYRIKELEYPRRVELGEELTVPVYSTGTHNAGFVSSTHPNRCRDTNWQEGEGLACTAEVHIDGEYAAVSTGCLPKNGTRRWLTEVPIDHITEPGIYSVYIKWYKDGNEEFVAEWSGSMEVYDPAEQGEYDLSINAPDRVQARELFPVEAQACCADGDFCPDRPYRLLVAGEEKRSGSVSLPNGGCKSDTLSLNQTVIPEPGTHTIALEVGDTVATDVIHVEPNPSKGGTGPKGLAVLGALAGGAYLLNERRKNS